MWKQYFNMLHYINYIKINSSFGFLNVATRKSKLVCASPYPSDGQCCARVICAAFNLES